MSWLLRQIYNCPTTRNGSAWSKIHGSDRFDLSRSGSRRAGDDGRFRRRPSDRRETATVQSSAHLDGGREDIAAAAYGLDHRRVLRIVFELAAETADLNVDRA